MTREEMMQQKAEIERQHRTVDGIIREPGKFEGEPVWTVALYDWWLDGGAGKEGGGESDSGERENAWAAFLVDDDMRAVYPELATCSDCGLRLNPDLPVAHHKIPFAVGIEETNNGFVYSQELSKEEFNNLDKPSRPSGGVRLS
jgi:hypothetical protein